VRPLPTIVFGDRRSAAQALIEELRPYATGDTAVLGLSRGGMIVAHEISGQLGLPLDVLVVQRITEPDQPWFGVGSLAEPAYVYLNRRRLRALPNSRDWLRPAINQGIQDVQQRAASYAGNRQRLSPSGRRVIVVDDSAATGCSLQVAVKKVRAEGAREIIIAVPVAPAPVVEWMRGQVDQVVCHARPSELLAHEIYYPMPLQDTQSDLQGLLLTSR
jgi:putative phosphoribosyl transferase